MRIENHTDWRTDQIKALLQRVALDELSPERRKALRVEIINRREVTTVGYCAGLAAIGGNWMRLSLPKQQLDLVDVAHTAAHEMAHTRGMEHRDMMQGNRYGYTEGYRERYAWAKEFVIEKKAPKPVAKPGDEQKHQHCLAMVRRWRSKAKRATTGLKHWTQRARYYEQKMAAKAAKEPA